MLSAFSRTQRTRRHSAGSKPHLDEVYDLRGLNKSDPDQVTQEGESPKAENCRMYAREDGQTRVAIRTRLGSRRMSTPVGETLNVQNVATSTGDVDLVPGVWLLEPFTPSSSGILTRLDVELKKTVAGGGHIIVEIFANSGGVPTTLLASSGILASAINSTYQYLPAYFIDAPSLVNATQHWLRLRIQDGGTAHYALRKTAASGGQSTVNPGTALTPLGYTWRYKSYLSTAGTVLGFTRRYPTNLANRTMFAMGINVYSVTDLGVPTSISTAINASATKVRFAHYEDNSMWVDGFGTAKKWDGTTVSDIAGAPSAPTHIAMHKNRGFFVPAGDPNRVDYTDLGNLETRASVNFFYVPSPKSSDHISAMLGFQDNLVIFTHETKHIIYGSDISTFTRQEAIGTKGAVSQEAVAADRNYIYFMGDDKQIYRYNGIDDELLSEKVEPELRAIPDASKVRLHLYRNQLRVYYPRGTQTQSENMLLLELSKKDSNKYLQWFQDTGRPVIGSLEWTQSNNELIEFSSRCGAMYYGEIGASDLGKAINFKYWTKYKAYGSGMAKDRVRKFRPFIRPADTTYTMQIGKDVDFANNPDMKDYVVRPSGALWGQFTWGDGTLWGSTQQLTDSMVAMSGRGKFTQYRFECSALEAEVELVGYGVLVNIGKAK